MLRSPPRYSDPELPALDDADRRLVEALMRDGRASGRKLSMETGLSEANVSRRLTRLLEEQTVRVRCFTPPEYLGLGCQACLFLRSAQPVSEVAAALRRHPHVSWIVSAFGVYDLVSYCCASCPAELLSMVDDTLARCPGIRAVSLAPMLEFHTPRFHVKAQPERRLGHGGMHKSLDQTDLVIIRALQQEGRLSYADLAQRTGISATSAADRFRRLTSEGIVDIVTIVDPPRLGMNLSGAMQIAAHGPLRPIMQELSKIPQLALFTVLAGEFPAYAAFNCRDSQDLAVVRAAVLAVPGVRDIQPLVFGTLFHESFEWGTHEVADRLRKPESGAAPAAHDGIDGGSNGHTGVTPPAPPTAPGP